MKLNKLTLWGMTVLAIGIIWEVIAFNMDISVKSGYGWERERVANLSLIANRQAHMMLAGLVILVGAILTAAGYMQQNTKILGSSRRICPYCAEKIKHEAKICRYCHQSVEPITVDEGASDEQGYSAYIQTDRIKDFAEVFSGSVVKFYRGEYPLMHTIVFSYLSWIFVLLLGGAVFSSNDYPYDGTTHFLFVMAIYSFICAKGIVASTKQHGHSFLTKFFGYFIGGFMFVLSLFMCMGFLGNFI